VETIWNEEAGSTRMEKTEELHYLYSSPNIIMVIRLRMRWIGHVAFIGETRNECTILVSTPEGEPRCN